MTIYEFFELSWEFFRCLTISYYFWVMATTAGTASGTGSYNFKVVLLGEGCVGKTSVVLRYVQDKFNEKHLTTLQVSCLLVSQYRIRL